MSQAPTPVIDRSDPDAAPDPAAALERLREIKHIVVLMMENRSFDQMLGFLQGAGLDVDGLAGAKPNFDAAGNEYAPFEWPLGETAPGPPAGHKAKILDPCHSPGCVHRQLADDNTGFVKNFAETRVDEEGRAVTLDPEFLRVPMGHYGADHLPVYDHLARNFCVCDAWHASIPGDTWPNRQYSIAGKAGEPVTRHAGFFHDLLDKLKGLGVNVGGLPIYEVEAFTRQLADSQWRWYSHDPATLRGIDARYRDFQHVNRDNFAYFDRKKVAFGTEVAEAPIVTHDSFLDDAAKGQLRDVSWIDPNFIDLEVLDPNSNDDHPPSDVKAGQALVLELYEALAKSPDWQDTLLVIVYDEHGGFYDHVAPPPIADDRSGFKTLGVRVPAIVVGPRVRRHVSHEVFDHTSLIATILRRFAADPEAALAAMPKRVREAPHLGILLEDAPRNDIDPHDGIHRTMADWRHQAREERRAQKADASVAANGAGHAMDLHDFQEEFARFALVMRRALPPSQP